MTEAERSATLAICLLAARADGKTDDRERAQLTAISETVAAGSDLARAHALSRAFQDVLVGKITLEKAAASLVTPEVKQLAFELAVVICDADGVRVPEERQFLERLRGALGLELGATEQFAQAADALAKVPAVPLQAGPATVVPAAAPGVPGVDQAALDEKIRNYAVLNGALELLPDSLATMAIVPLQLKMVYEIGKAHGYELDQGHIRDFIATAGVGLGAQYVEQIGRKLVGGLLGKLAGGLVGGLAGQALESGVSFATTYALGQLARRYYAAGRNMTPELLRETYQGLLAEARELRGKLAGQIEDRARGIDPSRIGDLVRGAGQSRPA
ncbi:MAG: TerB family tellurite resistance protein [Anaeromyxobacter sp.]